MVERHSSQLAHREVCRRAVSQSRVLGIPSGILEPRIVPVEVLNHEDHPLSINVPDEKPKYRHFVDETYVAVDEEFPDFQIRAIHKNQAGHPDSIGQKIDRKDVKADKYVEKIYVKIDQKPKAISKTVAQPKEAEGLQAKKDNGIHNEQPKKGNAAESEVYGDANGQAAFFTFRVSNAPLSDCFFSTLLSELLMKFFEEI
ncbi:hypothetical protein DdX_13665 [Ditylenchus destructor]|uniref:Uncharacterized protein n=1 Tax=Ditylenchus destructor TaxID=166010 RepID=A0AAD4R2E3_9BILA|nr:hypothetical protein DdX_13665 [Ditylenchus destructor]